MSLMLMSSELSTDPRLGIQIQKSMICRSPKNGLRPSPNIDGDWWWLMVIDAYFVTSVKPTIIAGVDGV